MNTMQMQMARGTDLHYRMARKESGELGLTLTDSPYYTHGIIARHDGEIVGALMLVEFVIGNFEGAGTWIDPSWRRQGLAVKLWRRFYELFSPTRVEVVVISMPGLALSRRLEMEFPGRFFFDAGH